MDLELDLSLHLGPTAEKFSSSTATAQDVQQEVDLELRLSFGPAKSVKNLLTTSKTDHINEGSSSLQLRGGNSIPQLEQSPTSYVPIQGCEGQYGKPASDLSSSIMTTSTNYSSRITQKEHSNSSKTCMFRDCGKRARGSSGLCISHGGGRRCQRPGCHSSAAGPTVYCKTHGGGRPCESLGCTKSAQGNRDYCIAHGVGQRCSHQGCTAGARRKYGFCIRHGGGKRCGFEGGGICQKSVQGGTLFCVAHGGGKRCAMSQCTKSAIGQVGYCFRHGGGRSKSDGCNKIAQGSTDFCKDHEGPTRCSWEHLGSLFGQNDTACASLARVKYGLCTSHSGLLQDKHVHGSANLGFQTNGFVHSAPMSFGLEEGTSVEQGTSTYPTAISEGRVHGG